MPDTATLTERQAHVLHALADEPRRAIAIARDAGLEHNVATGCLIALREKGLARKHLNPTRWSRP